MIDFEPFPSNGVDTTNNRHALLPNADGAVSSVVDAEYPSPVFRRRFDWLPINAYSHAAPLHDGRLLSLVNAKKHRENCRRQRSTNKHYGVEPA